MYAQCYEFLKYFKFAAVKGFGKPYRYSCVPNKWLQGALYWLVFGRLPYLLSRYFCPAIIVWGQLPQKNSLTGLFFFKNSFDWLSRKFLDSKYGFKKKKCTDKTFEYFFHTHALVSKYSNLKIFERLLYPPKSYYTPTRSKLKLFFQIELRKLEMIHAVKFVTLTSLLKKRGIGYSQA